MVRRNRRALRARKDIAVFRTAIRGTAAVGALAALVSLTACGPVQMGAAAVFGTERVSTSTLSNQVASLDAVYKAYPSLQSEVQYKPADMPRLVLMWLVRFRVVDAIAARSGVQVTPAEAQRAIVQAAAQIEQQTGSAITPAQFAVFNALPPGLNAAYGRYQATIEKLAVAYTGAANTSSLTAAQQQQVAARISAEVKRLNIKINPQFGQLDAAQLTIGAPQIPLSRSAALGAAQLSSG